MKVSRRGFITTSAGVAAAAVAAPALSGLLLPKALGEAASQETGERVGYTVCSMCPSGCGLEVRVVNGKAVKVEGNPLHPLNQGVCCPKGQASLEALYSPERLAVPLRRKAAKSAPARGASDWEPVSWDEAIKIVSDRLRGLRDQGQAHTVGIVHGELRGQLNPLVRRFLAAYGSPNDLSTDSLDAAAIRLASYFGQGINGYPVYDIDNARYVLSFGGSLLESSRHLQKLLSGYGYMHRGRNDRGKLVVADSRLSVSAAKADEWIPIRPGTLGALALGIAYVLIKSGAVNQAYVDRWCFGYEDFQDDQGRTHMGFKRMVVEQYTLERAADITGVDGGTIAKVAGEFGASSRALAIAPTGRGDLAAGNGLYTALAIQALNALVGSIEVPGGVLTQQYPSFTQWPAFQPDAAAQKGTKEPRLDGAGAVYPLAYSACQDLAANLAAAKPYAANALLLMNTDPVHEFPQGAAVAQALLKVPFVVSFSPVLDESAACADLILPSLTFFEMWQDDILEGTGYQGVALRQPVVSPVKDGRNPGDVILQVAKAIGGSVSQAMPWPSFEQVVRDRIAGMDISWDDLVATGAWSALIYRHAGPGSKAWGQAVGRDRTAAPKDGRYDLFSREMFASLSAAGQVKDLDCLPHFEVPAETADGAYPLELVCQQTMTQPRNWTGILPSLTEAYGVQLETKWEGWVEIHPKVAEALGIRHDDWVIVESASGKIKVRARLVEGIWANAVNIAPGQGLTSAVQWGRETGTAGRTIGANTNDLLPARSERLTGLAACLPTRVRIRKA